MGMTLLHNKKLIKIFDLIYNINMKLATINQKNIYRLKYFKLLAVSLKVGYTNSSSTNQQGTLANK